MTTRDEHLLYLNTEIEKLERRLGGYDDRMLHGERHSPTYSRTIEQQQTLVAERDRLLLIPPASTIRRESKSNNPETAIAEAILKKKARISEIERTLSRPLPTERRGQPVSGGSHWRLRLEEERQHLLNAVAELEWEGTPRLQALTDGIKMGVVSEADGWRDFHDKFMLLANKERTFLQSTRKGRALSAYCDYKDHPEVIEPGKPKQGFFCLLRTPECGVWILSHGPNEPFQAEFRALATRAGCAIGGPQGALPEDVWLHRLFLDLRENGSDELLAASDEGGMILKVCTASATFCSRLEKKALETSASSLELNANLVNERKSFVLPILENKGWSVLDWAKHSEVDFHTADNYLKGKTKSYNSTRTKLANALGVEVQKFPS